MGYFDELEYDVKTEELSEKIEKAYNHYNARISIEAWKILRDRTIFQLKLKGGTRESHVFDRAHDVQLRLGLYLFVPITVNFHIHLIVSDQEIVYDHLPHILSDSRYEEEVTHKHLPYIIGYDFIGLPVIADLSQFVHLLVGGATNSGKTVGLQALIVSIAYNKSPNQVNLILIDVGATNLIPFGGMPHLSCPVIRECCEGYRVLNMLKDEMERRIELQVTGGEQFKKLPRIVLIIDEFPALLARAEDKFTLKTLTANLSSLLQRGRHAKIHVVLAAQNPTIQNMKVDLGNITARIAFKCAKKNFSETILGEGGAEKLLGHGDMYIRVPQYGELKRIQGIFISQNELRQTVLAIKIKYGKMMFGRKFTIKEMYYRQEKSDHAKCLVGESVKGKRKEDDKFAKVALWTLGRNLISCNTISEAFNVGWRRANGFIKQLYDLGLVGDLDAKLPRKVLPQSIEELTQEVMDIFANNGISREMISGAIYNRE